MAPTLTLPEPDEPRKFEELSFVPLQQASLCMDCEMISAAQSTCQACGSTALLNIARTLDHPNRSYTDILAGVRLSWFIRSSDGAEMVPRIQEGWR